MHIAQYAQLAINIKRLCHFDPIVKQLILQGFLQLRLYQLLLCFTQRKTLLNVPKAKYIHIFQNHTKETLRNVLPITASAKKNIV